MRRGCEAEAAIAVRMVVPDFLSDDTSTDGMLLVNLCRHHFDRATPDEFLSACPEIVELLTETADPGTEPDWDNAYLEPVFIGGMTWQAFKALEVVAH